MIVDCDLSGAILFLVPYILTLNLPLGLCGIVILQSHRNRSTDVSSSLYPFAISSA